MSRDGRYLAYNPPNSDSIHLFDYNDNTDRAVINGQLPVLSGDGSHLAYVVGSPARAYELDLGTNVALCRLRDQQRVDHDRRHDFGPLYGDDSRLRDVFCGHRSHRGLRRQSPHRVAAK